MTNRTIKFRAWNKKKKKMIYLDDASLNLGKDWWNFTLGCNQCFDSIVDDENGILMQYTEFKDKNSKEEYGGDLVKFQQKIYEIKKWNGCWCLWTEKNGEGRVAWYFNQIDPAMLEVIGNIYENSEVLK